MKLYLRCHLLHDRVVASVLYRSVMFCLGPAALYMSLYMSIIDVDISLNSTETVTDEPKL